MLNSTRIEGKEGFLRPCVMESNEAGGAAGIKVAAEAAPHQDAAELVEAMQGERSPQRRENYGRRP